MEECRLSAVIGSGGAMLGAFAELATHQIHDIVTKSVKTHGMLFPPAGL
jgi:hypothetical protein